ncbi:hypothetical protein [Paenibacillus sp.]|uniref:hypothetical protein n=1 Tax=Paenibacillus sp. TaxID=58172 RepID=UPI002D44B617|nr:hypothetical protein [Paenibacillus sp.]HZG88521.1 hypothetical protein [Paenibacillus sp.]
MAERDDIVVERGRVAGGGEPRAVWDVPLAAPEAVRRAARELAADPLLEGRWLAGAATEADRERLGLRESGWRSSCACGSAQPCRHAQSALFRFRQEAKRDPWLWWEAMGEDRHALQAAVRDARAELARAAAEGRERAAIRAVRAAEAGRSAGGEPWMLSRLSDPAFWNRDTTLAEWLKPLAEAVRAKEEPHEP